jgi:heme-degrading monooxygenase HmoA
MYARNVTINLKPDSANRLSQKFEQDILPRLKRQDGFQDAIMLLSEGGKSVIAISLWDGKESAEAYGRTTYPEVLQGLAAVTEGSPKVTVYEVASSTFHNIPAHA